MMKLNIGKSALLAVAMTVAVSTTTHTQQVPAVPNGAVVIGQNKAATLAVATLFALWVDMKTNSNKEMFETTLTEDCNKIAESFNLFDAEFYKKVGILLRKVIAGRPVKFVNKDIPQEDGSTIKGKKTLSQKPYGALGLFDAYVLSQIEDFMDNIPTLAGLYVLLGSPELPWQNAFKKASGDK